MSNATKQMDAATMVFLTALVGERINRLSDNVMTHEGWTGIVQGLELIVVSPTGTRRTVTL